MKNSDKIAQSYKVEIVQKDESKNIKNRNAFLPIHVGILWQ